MSHLKAFPFLSIIIHQAFKNTESVNVSNKGWFKLQYYLKSPLDGVCHKTEILDRLRDSKNNFPIREYEIHMWFDAKWREYFFETFASIASIFRIQKNYSKKKYLRRWTPLYGTAID